VIERPEELAIFIERLIHQWQIEKIGRLAVGYRNVRGDKVVLPKSISVPGLF
jgi:hypothetical protein